MSFKEYLKEIKNNDMKVDYIPKSPKAAFKGWKDKRNDPSKAITFGDGTPLNAEDAHFVADLAEEITFDVPWKDGDVALVDNYVAMHGRRTFVGTRKVLASLVAG